MTTAVIAAKMAKLLPQALAGDPISIAILAAAGIAVAVKKISENSGK